MDTPETSLTNDWPLLPITESRQQTRSDCRPGELSRGSFLIFWHCPSEAEKTDLAAYLLSL